MVYAFNDDKSKFDISSLIASKHYDESIQTLIGANSEKTFSVYTDEINGYTPIAIKELIPQVNNLVLVSFYVYKVNYGTNAGKTCLTFSVRNTTNSAITLTNIAYTVSFVLSALYTML